MSQLPMLAPNTILQNRYRIVRQLGKGGMGAVYEAVDQRLSSIVAIKETLVNTDEARQAFEREASLLANLRHRSLPNVTDHFAEGEGQYLVMQFIPGHDLAELLELRKSPFPVEDVLPWADEILKALEYLHAHNPPILHRDIKPANLKLTGEGELFLIDFGLSKGAAGQMPTLLTSRSVKGYTPAYSPLEQIHGGGTDPRSDLYSVAATLYHLLTNLQPIDAPTRFNALDDLQADPLLPADQINPEVPRAIAQVIAQAMQMNRRNRPPSATAMRRLLREAATSLAEASPTIRREPAPEPTPTEPPRPNEPVPPTLPTRPARRGATSPDKLPSPEPTMKEVPNLIERPARLPATSGPLPISEAPPPHTPRRMSPTVLVLLVSVVALSVLALGAVLVVPLLNKRAADKQLANADSSPTPSSDRQPVTPSPSPTPIPSPEFVKVRLRLISEGASGCSVMSDVKVTLTTRNRSFSAVTNRNGFAVFADVPCGEAAKINAIIAPEMKFNISRSLECSSNEIYLGAYGVERKVQVSEKLANSCYK